MNYYIQGNKEKADQIKAAFNGKGIYSNCNFANENYLYYQCDGKVAFCFIGGGLANIIKTHPDYKELELPIEPKFKVGDDIKTGNTIETIAEVDYATRSYCCESGRTIWFENQDLWHLVPKPHYDISNFKPFDKVLVRDEDDGKWMAAFYSHYMYEEKDYPYQFATIGTDIYGQCIPFEWNEHLFRTTDMCNERFINW